MRALPFLLLLSLAPPALPPPAKNPTVYVMFTGICQFLERANGTIRVILPNAQNGGLGAKPHRAAVMIAKPALIEGQTTHGYFISPRPCLSWAIAYLDGETMKFSPAPINSIMSTTDRAAFDADLLDLQDIDSAAQLAPAYDQNSPNRFLVSAQFDISGGTPRVIAPPVESAFLTGMTPGPFPFPSYITKCLTQAVVLPLEFAPGTKLVKLITEGGEFAIDVSGSRLALIMIANSLDSDILGVGVGHETIDPHFPLHYMTLQKVPAGTPIPWETANRCRSIKTPQAEGLDLAVLEKAVCLRHIGGGSNCPPVRFKMK